MKKRKRSWNEKCRKKEHKTAFTTVYVNGRQKRVRRPPMIDGMLADEFIARNADPIWLHENELWELMPLVDDVQEEKNGQGFNEVPF